MMLWPLLLGCLVLAGGIARAMAAVGPLDQPDARKLHTLPVPRGGGLGIVVAFLLGMETLSANGMVDIGYFRGVMLAAALLAGVGWLDDLRNLPFWSKLVAQAVAAGIAVASGLVLPLGGAGWYGPGWSGPGWCGAAVTLGWLMLVTNAVNFIDGMNGLAGLVVLVAAGCVAGLVAPGWASLAGALLAAGAAGFLPFNFPRARVFLGDVGSQFCGFMLGVIGVAAAGQGDLTLMPLLLSAVLWDVGFTLARRALAGNNLAQAHRGHLYQLAQRAGMDARLVALMHAGFAALGGWVAWRGLAGQPGWLLLPIGAQLGWTLWVLQRARRASVGPW